MNPDIIAGFREYESLKLEEKKIKTRLEELKPILLPHVPEDQELESDYGVFIKKTGKTSWTYSELTQSKIEAVDKLKTEEQRTGVAKEKHGAPFIEYRQKDKS